MLPQMHRTEYTRWNSICYLAWRTVMGKWEILPLNKNQNILLYFFFTWECIPKISALFLQNRLPISFYDFSVLVEIEIHDIFLFLQQLTMESLKEFDWCLDQLECLQASKTIGDMASNKVISLSFRCWARPNALICLEPPPPPVNLLNEQNTMIQLWPHEESYCLQSMRKFCKNSCKNREKL